MSLGQCLGILERLFHHRISPTYGIIYNYGDFGFICEIIR